MGQGTKDSVLVIFQIPEQTLTFDLPKTKGLWSYSTQLCYVTLYYFYLYYWGKSFKYVCVIYMLLKIDLYNVFIYFSYSIL